MKSCARGRRVSFLTNSCPGTSPVSGISLLATALKRLANMRCKVVCTTHLLEVFSHGLLRDGIGGVKAFQMAIRVPDKGEDALATPLFQLQSGVAKSSAGLVCARRAGLQKSVVDRAKQVISALKDGIALKPYPPALSPVSDCSVEEKRGRGFLHEDGFLGRCKRRRPSPNATLRW